MHRFTPALILIAPLLACPGDGAGTDATASTGGSTGDAVDTDTTGGTSAASTTTPETSSPTTGEPETTAVLTVDTTTDATTTDDSTTGVPMCMGDLPRLELSLLAGSDCAFDAPEEDVIEGTFTATPDGFEVANTGGTVAIGPEQPAIPDGTFVRMTYGCTPGFYGDAGGFVLLENLDSLEGDLNQTESGERLWFFMTAGGEAYSYTKAPFTIEPMAFCGDGEPFESYSAQRLLRVSGPGFMVDVPPGESAELSAADGPHAGAYTFENVNYTDIGFEGGDATSNINMRIVRAG